MEAQEYQKQLNRLSHQLTLAEQLLKRHPLLNEKSAFFQAILRLLNLRIYWSSSGKLAPLLMTFHMALIGSTRESSAAGFMGKIPYTLQQVEAKLMGAYLPLPSLGLTDFLLLANQTITVGVIYLATQLTNGWKGVFPRKDPVAARRGASLYQELVILFLLNSGFMQQLFKSLAKSLEVGEKEQKVIVDIGIFQLCLSLFALVDQYSELPESLARFMKPTLDSLDAALQKAQARGLIEEQAASTALSQVQLFRLALEDGNKEMMTQALEEGFNAFDLSYEDFKKDLKMTAAFCSQLNDSLKNTFDQQKQAMTTLTQAA
jgi:hypothetical protein